MAHEHTDNFRDDDRRLLDHVTFAKGFSTALNALFLSGEKATDEPVASAQSD